MTEDDVRRIIREEIDRARYLAPVHIVPRYVQPAPMYPTPVYPQYPTYWPATCTNVGYGVSSNKTATVS